MLPNEESVYYGVYFYCAILEYVYFVIIHIQRKGPKHIAEIEKHLKFFKTEVNKFIYTFSGKDKKEKCCNMLCTATPVFYSTNYVVYLKENISDYKNIIFDDLIFNKTIDIILRGVCNIEKIVEHLNVCSVIKMNKNTFLSFLKQYPCFYINKNEVIVLLECKNLLNFHNHSYEVIVQYFLNILQNSCVIRYENIESHSKFLSSHRFYSSLGILCVLNSCDIFKCENSSVFLIKNYTEKIAPKQQLNIDYSETDLVDPVSSLTLFIYQTLGPKLFNWTGHVSQVMKNGGLIFCSVGFKDNEQDMFVVYFHKKALKCIVDISNLSEHVAFQDVVKFDAEFCIGAGGRYYEATRVSVEKHHFENGFFNQGIDLKEYSQNISQQYFLQISKPNLPSACPFRFNSLKTPSLTAPCITNYVPTNYKGFVSLSKNSHTLHASENMEFTGAVFKPCIKTNEGGYNFVFEDDFISTNSTTSIMPKDEKSFKEVKRSKNTTVIKTKVKKNCEEHLDVFKNIFKENHSLQKEKLILDNKQMKNFLILKYTFLFGEVDMLTKEGGIINCVCDTTFTVYFHHKSILTLEDHIDPKNISRLDKVLIFSPNINKDTYPVATLVYLLKDEETMLIQKYNLTTQDFIVKYFLPKMKSKRETLTRDYELCPNLTFDFPFHTNFRKVRDIRTNFYKLVNSLNKIYTFDQNFLRRFLRLLNVIQKKNVKLDCMAYTSVFHFTLWKTFKFKRQRKDLSKYAESQNSAKHLYPSNNFTVKQNESEVKLNLKNKSSILNKSKSETNLKRIIPNDQIYNSCSSLSSFMSCESIVLSDKFSFMSCESIVLSDKFYSCESSINMSEVEETDFKSPFKCSLNKNYLSLSHSDISKITAKNFSFKTREPISNKSIDLSQENISEFIKKSKHKLIKKSYFYENKTLHFKSFPKFKKTKVRKERHCFMFFDSLILSSEPVVKTACICMITNSYLFLSSINYEKDFFCFPLESVSAGLKTVLRINLIVEITYIPFKPLNMSHLLFLKIQPDFEQLY